MHSKICGDIFVYPTVAAGSEKVENLSAMTHQNVNLTALLKLNTNDAREFLCGWGAAVINVTVTYPVNKVIFRQVKIIYDLFI